MEHKLNKKAFMPGIQHLWCHAKLVGDAIVLCYDTDFFFMYNFTS